MQLIKRWGSRERQTFAVALAVCGRECIVMGCLYELPQAVEDGFRRFGLPIPASSRFHQMRRCLSDRDGRPVTLIPADSVNFEVALEAQRDLQIMSLCFDEMKDVIPYPALADLVRRVRDDAVLPKPCTEQARPELWTRTPGRDAQCHLYVYAVCGKADLQPVVDEPDIRCTVDKQLFGIAVKRVKTLKAFRGRLEEAAEQLNRHGIEGVVVVDISVALNRDNRRVGPISDYEFGAMWRAAKDRFVRDHFKRMQEWVRGKGVLGVLLIEHHLRWVAESQWALETHTAAVELTEHNQRRSRIYNEFWKRYNSALKLISNRSAA